MPPQNSTYPAGWVNVAEKDLKRVHLHLREDDPEAAGFLLQQAIEKFLKAFLLTRGWKLRRTHNLVALLDDAVAYDPGLELFRAVCQEVTNYYLIERYPTRQFRVGIATTEVRESLQAAADLIEKLRRAAG